MPRLFALDIGQLGIVCTSVGLPKEWSKRWLNAEFNSTTLGIRPVFSSKLIGNWGKAKPLLPLGRMLKLIPQSVIGTAIALENHVLDFQEIPWTSKL